MRGAANRLDVLSQGICWGSATAGVLAVIVLLSTPGGLVALVALALVAVVALTLL